ncbi:unnamed protein product [Sphagnum troendelagicum]
MDRLKSTLSRSNYRHVWKAHPEMLHMSCNGLSESDHDHHCNVVEQDEQHACGYHKISKSTNPFVVVSIDGSTSERNGGSRGGRDHRRNLDQSCKKTTRRAAAAGSSFDFGVSVDPPTQLIGSFLQRQRESGGNSLDMGLNNMELEDAGATAHCNFRDSCENSQLLQAGGDMEVHDSTAAADDWTKLRSRSRSRNKSTKSFKLYSGERRSSDPDTPASVSGVLQASATFNRQKSRIAEMSPAPAASDKSNPMMQSGGIAAAGQDQQHKSHQLRSQQLKSGVLRHTGMLGRLEEEDDPLKDVDVPDRYRSQKWNYLIFLEFVAFVMIVGALVCSTVVPHLRRHVTLWGLNLWRWVVLALVIVCGRLVSSWIIRVVVFFLERSFLLRKKVLYFVYGLRRGVQNCLWLSFVLLAWHFVFDPRVQQATKVLIYVTKVLQCLLIAAALAMVKTLLVKVLASCFHVDTYFERIRDSLYNQYLLETLSGPPLFKAASQSSIAAALQQQKLENEIAGLRNAGAVAPGLKKKSGFIGRGSGLGGGDADDDYNSKNKNKKCETISIEELNKFSRKNISAWNMKRLVKLVKHTGVVTLADNIHDDVNNGETEVNSEWQAKIAAKQIFKNVAKPGCKFIDKDDLLQFVSEEEVTHVLALFDAAVESEKITAQALMNWTVNVYKERRALALSLCDTKTAVNKLHRFINALMFMTVIIIWLLVLGIATTHLILFLSSQLLLVVFVFGNTCKQIFEAIIFLFVMHPFDVGDRCVIDGNQLVVEEMNILTTVFLGDADVKIWYPNSVLATKPIQNFYRSPDMGDNFDFIVAASTPAEKIAQLKERIGRYIQCKSNHWKPDFCLIILDIVEMHQLLLSLGLTHTINHQDFGEKMSRKSDLLWEMKKIFEDLHIDYHLQPQDIILHKGTNNFPITYL